MVIQDFETGHRCRIAPAPANWLPRSAGTRHLIKKESSLAVDDPEVVRLGDARETAQEKANQLLLPNRLADEALVAAETICDRHGELS
jgi:hypothetical protein